MLWRDEHIGEISIINSQKPYPRYTNTIEFTTDDRKVFIFNYAKLHQLIRITNVDGQYLPAGRQVLNPNSTNAMLCTVIFYLHSRADKNDYLLP